MGDHQDEKGTSKQLKLEPGIHRRILSFLNEAIYPEDLVYEKMAAIHDEGNPIHEDNPEELDPKRKKILDLKIAKEIIDFRDREYPLGFRNLRELFEIKRFDDGKYRDILNLHFSDAMFGNWTAFPVNIPRRGPGFSDGVVHAALLHTGKVLFITADETTLLWDPENVTPATFEDPDNQPHTMPGGYSQLCSHHVFLSDGNLLSVGGGGYGPNPLARWGYKFDPEARKWTRTSKPMSESKWYPTAVALGDNRVLVTCGNRSGQMDAYDEATDTFSEINSGDDRGFPNLYPGLHLLPNHAVFYSRTGWGTAGAGGTATADDDPMTPQIELGGTRSAYFTFTSMGANTGSWNDITAAMTNRAKGMSVMLFSNTAPYLRILILGGVDNATNHTYEIIDASILSSSSSWSAPIAFPDAEHRSLCSAVLLPDGDVFVCGGIQRINSPCTLFNPQTNSWSPMAALPSIRDYHSVALLLPSGKVMMAGWNNATIEIYSPPYLFRGARPLISSAPPLVHHGQSFVIESPDASSIVKVVLVRPMAVTHQTDSEQKVLEMPYIHDHANPTRLTLTAPHGGHPHSLAQQGYYMMFAINNNGVPSVAKWINLH